MRWWKPIEEDVRYRIEGTKLLVEFEMGVKPWSIPTDVRLCAFEMAQNIVCPDCEGEGWYAQQLDDAGNAVQVQCRKCLGSGLIEGEDG